MKINYIYALIVLECRLSREQACALFSKSNEELEGLFYNLFFSHPMIYEALKYVFNYETVLPNAAREKRAKTLAWMYLRRLITILKEKDLKKKSKDLNSFVKNLEGPDISFAFKKKSGEYTEEEKALLTRFQVKYALSNSAIGRKMHMGHTTVLMWGMQVKDEKLRQLYQELHEYYLSMGENIAQNYYNRRK